MADPGVAAASIAVEVVYAEPDRTWRVTLDLPAGATAAQALDASGYFSRFPGQEPGKHPAIGIYGRACAPDHVLRDGDRLEIYRPLDFDPLESRRRRAAHKRAGSKGRK
ncbi:RnfH family protein [Candidimonas humi]|uniref:UPF0125 protein ACFOY1_01295 n=1 Tax=Candidimonas humi TaxID=683355 RepID=A0ABV8NRE7_9BURK|nr:RnfH family protein [Candidimonas humi]MBV6303587.1 RnfH family protein [Candidimonas humi]